MCFCQGYLVRVVLKGNARKLQSLGAHLESRASRGRFNEALSDVHFLIVSLHVSQERSTSSSFYSPTSSRRVQVPVHANFIRAYTLKKTNTSLRSRVGKVLDSYFVTNLMAVAVLADSFCTCASVDARAAGAELAYGYSVIAQVCLCLYTTELLCNAYVRGSKMCRDWIGALDVVARLSLTIFWLFSCGLLSVPRGPSISWSIFKWFCLKGS